MLRWRALTVPSCLSVCFIEHAFTSHKATTLPAAAASSPLLRKVTAFTTFSCMSTVDEPAASADSSPRPSRESMRWSPAPAAIAER